ncbi:MAG TPA: MATE family efflux transporter, partial [Bryobacteraceae bacterium]|nr:MATE family efflux transporter [Bryobacteraceae bacterium]
NAVATVGLTESLLTLVFAVALGVSMSTTAMVARRIGEKDHAGAGVAAGQAILLGTAISIAIGLPAFFFARELLQMMAAPADLVAEGWRYTAIVLGSNVVVMLLFINNAIFRGAGDASIAMRVLWMSNLINLVMDPCLIFGWGPFPELGLTGAGYSTLVGRSFGVAYQLWVLMSGSARVKVAARDLMVVPAILKSLVRVSSTGVLQFAIAHSSWIVLVRFISSFGSVAVAGYTIGIRIFIFVVLPSWGLSGAAATMVGQNLGAKKPERAEKAVWLTGFYNSIYMGLIAVLFLLIPAQIVGLFTSDPEVARHAIDCLRIVALGNLFYAFGMVMVQAFNGAGDTVTPTWINVIGFWLCEIPLAWALAYPVGWGVRGVFASIPIAECLITAIGLFMFMKGTWKEKKI